MEEALGSNLLGLDMTENRYEKVILAFEDQDRDMSLKEGGRGSDPNDEVVRLQEEYHDRKLNTDTRNP